MIKEYRLGIENDDLELIKKAKNGDAKAAEVLFKRYQKLLFKASQQRHLRSVSDEAYGEACIGFYEAVLDFDVSLGVPFAGYAKSKVYACVHNLFRRYLRIWQNEMASLMSCGDGEEEYDCLEGMAGSADMSENVVMNVALSDILIKLPSRQQQVAKCILVDGMNMTQAARCLDVSVQSVSKNYAKALSFIKVNYH